MSRVLVIAIVAVAGCGGGGRSVRTVEEMPAGTCTRQKLAPGESCSRGARDYSAGATVSVPTSDASQLGGNAWFRWPLFDAALDERTMRRGTIEHRSIAGGIGTHLRPLAFWPNIQRYVDVAVNLGFDLGVVREGSAVRGRGDGYIGGAIDIYAPDMGPFRYLEHGVPGFRVGVRYTAFVQGWESDTTFELGLIWRWGKPIDLYHHWTWQRGGD